MYSGCFTWMHCKGRLCDQTGLLRLAAENHQQGRWQDSTAHWKHASPSPENCAPVASVGVFTCAWSCVCVFVYLCHLYICVCLHVYMHTSAIYGQVCVCAPLCISLRLVQVRRRVALWHLAPVCLRVSRFRQRTHPCGSSQLFCERVRLLGRERRLPGDISRERTDSSWLDLDSSSLSPTFCPPNCCPKF